MRTKRERHRIANEPIPDVDSYLFGHGLTLQDYALNADGVVSFRGPGGRAFDLIIDQPQLAAAVCERLRALGVSDSL
ncbi:MAG: hypothetical protein JSR86_16930 [Proteobacteria bacterium]|nr:hypothetical protein [Pseudomonadota bacterium]